MILNSIILHNFMSYADAALDLSTISVACLSGQNGAGKSALLDAITWALWERARSSSDGLIRVGEREMWVDLHFIYESHHYRVRRVRQRFSGKAGSRMVTRGSLEFQVFDAPDLKCEVAATPAAVENLESCAAHDSAKTQTHNKAALSVRQIRSVCEAGIWRSLTGPSMRETQKAICELLRMDFETFVNSAYLRQGRADEFTMRPPSERKQILGEILGLSYFDRLQERAKEKVRTLKAQIGWVESALQVQPDIERRIIENSEQLKLHEEQSVLAAAQLAEWEQTLKDLEERSQSLRLTTERAEQAKQQTSRLIDDLQALTEQEQALLTRRHALTSLIEKQSEIEQKSREFQQVKAELEKLDGQALQMQDLQTRKIELQSMLAQLRSRLEVEADHHSQLLLQLQSTQARLRQDTSDSEKIREAHRLFRQLVSQEGELASRQEAFVHLHNRAAELQAAVGEARIRLEAELGQKELAIQDCEALVLARESLEQQKLALQAEAERLDKTESTFELVEERGISIKSKLESSNLKLEELKRRQQEWREKIGELRSHSDSTLCPLCAAPIVDRSAVISRYQKEIASSDDEISNVLQNCAELENERHTLRKSYRELKQELEGRKFLDTQIGQYNERLNAIERGAAMLQRLTQERDIIRHRLDAQQYGEVERESLIAIKAEIYKLDFDPVAYANLQAQIRSQRHLESKFQQLQKDLAELEKIDQQLPQMQEKVQELQGELRGETYGAEPRKELYSIRQQIDDLKYDRHSHVELRKALSELMPQVERLRDLQRALADLPMLDQSLTNCQTILNQKRAQKKELTSDLERFQKEIEELPELTEHLMAARSRLHESRSIKEDLIKRNAVLMAERDYLANKRQELQQQQLTLDQAYTELDDFSLLADAFGKKGIQAVIIENAVPEIEAEANRILTRLSDNRMHVALVTQHRTRSGSIIETLDILIADEVGTRNYELYSGGEAFKVDFSIRVALSRLLTRRSGAKLETLIIDEGFGSQDDVSRDKLVRVIRSIQSDFARILVVTHIADVREMFPTQIQVVKVNGSSSFQVVS